MKRSVRQVRYLRPSTLNLRPAAGSEPPSGFTLIELLVVISIIAILAGMIIVGVGTVRRKAYQAKARSNISSLQVALSAYNSLTGVYPSRNAATPADDPEILFKGLYTGNPKLGGSRENHVQDWPMEQLGKWEGPSTDPDHHWLQPDEAMLDFTTSYNTPIVFLDPWGRPFHYVEWESFPTNQRTLGGGQLKAKGGSAFAIWSDGANKTNEYGAGDDVNNWSEKGGG